MEQENPSKGLTRRQVLTYASAFVAGGLVAGGIELIRNAHHPATKLREQAQSIPDDEITYAQAAEILPLVHEIFAASEFAIGDSAELLKHTVILPHMAFIKDITSLWTPEDEGKVRNLLGRQVPFLNSELEQSLINILQQRTLGRSEQHVYGGVTQTVSIINLDDISRKRDNDPIEQVPRWMNNSCGVAKPVSEVLSVALHEWSHARNPENEGRQIVLLKDYIQEIFPERDPALFNQRGFNIAFETGDSPPKYLPSEEFFASYATWRIYAEANLPMVYTYQEMLTPADFVNLRTLLKYTNITDEMLAQFHYDSQLEELILLLTKRIKNKNPSSNAQDILLAVASVWINKGYGPSWKKVFDFIPNIIPLREPLTAETITSDPTLCRRVSSHY